MNMSTRASLAERAARVAAVAGAHADDVDVKGRFPREAVAAIYSNPNADAVEDLLRRYHVGYVYVGPLERRTYPFAGLAKFETARGLFRLAYENPEVRIYRVVGGDAEDVVLGDFCERVQRPGQGAQSEPR